MHNKLVVMFHDFFNFVTTTEIVLSTNSTITSLFKDSNEHFIFRLTRWATSIGADYISSFGKHSLV